MLFFLFIFPLLYFYYVGFIAEHSNQVGNAGVKGMCKMTVGTRDSNLNRRTDAELYHRFSYGIRLGTFLLWVVGLGAAFHPVGWAINMLVLGVALAWIFSGFLFNPAPNLLLKIWYGITGGIYGFLRATLEMVPIVLAGYLLAQVFGLISGVWLGWKFSFILGTVFVRIIWGLVKEGLLFASYFNQRDYLWEIDNFLNGFLALYYASSRAHTAEAAHGFGLVIVLGGVRFCAGK